MKSTRRDRTRRVSFPDGSEGSGIVDVGLEGKEAETKLGVSHHVALRSPDLFGISTGNLGHPRVPSTVEFNFPHLFLPRYPLLST